jgi:hypothetical protein
MSSPIPGKLNALDNKTSTYDTGDDDFFFYNMFQTIIMKSSVSYLTFFICYDLIYTLYDLKMKHNKELHKLYCMIALQIALYVTGDIYSFQSEPLTLVNTPSQSKKQEYYKDAIMSLHGILRNRTLYDKAISERECVFGLYCMLVNKLRSKSIEELHDMYIRYEGDDINNRKSKTIIIDSKTKTIFTQFGVAAMYGLHQSSKYDKLSSALIFRLIENTIDPSTNKVTDAMIETNVNDHNRINPNSPTTKGEIERMVKTLTETLKGMFKSY